MERKQLEGKRILMLGGVFFNYGQIILEGLRKMGAIVDHYDDRPSRDVVTLIALRYRLRFVRPKVKKYYASIIRENREKAYDYVFVIRGEAADPEMVAMLRRAYPRARFILYLWDSVDNVPDGKKKLGCYDRVLSFDRVDAQNYGMVFRPLFFVKECQPELQQTKYKYDAAFIGTAHTIRPRIVRQMSQICREQGRSFYSFLYLPHPVVYYYRKLTNRDYKGVKRSHIHFTPMKPEDIQTVYAQTRCVLDVEHNQQRGLTMRTIEMLGMGKKIITTNTQVADYDFYDPRNIYIIDRQDPQVPDAFWQAAYAPIPEAVLQRYSLAYFLQEIFNTEGE